MLKLSALVTPFGAGVTLDLLSLNFFGVTYHFLVRYWDPYYYRRRPVREDSRSMTFIESVSG